MKLGFLEQILKWMKFEKANMESQTTELFTPTA